MAPAVAPAAAVAAVAVATAAAGLRRAAVVAGRRGTGPVVWDGPLPSAVGERSEAEVGVLKVTADKNKHSEELV